MDDPGEQSRRAPRAPDGPARRPSPLREAHKELTRESLIDAAQAAFEAKGYIEVTVDDIVRGAGASRGTFYLYFESKADVMKAVLDRLHASEGHRRLLDHFAALEGPTVDALQAWIEEYVDFYEANRGLHRAIHQAQSAEPSFTDTLLANMQGYVDLWASLGFVENAGDRDLRLAALMMFAVADRVLYLWLVHGYEVDREKTTRALAESFHTTLQVGRGRP